MREYYVFILQQHANEGQTLVLGGRFFQQFIVDAYTCIEEAHLQYIQDHQVDFRTNPMNDVLSGDIDSTIVRKQVILPSIFTEVQAL